ncbi:MAG: HEPN domain-containing protein [Candidatus Bipolaricaulota bacterium]|nr:HEPN domain-containing protein [Candidatus Bipolaricaulota bacterium]
MGKWLRQALSDLQAARDSLKNGHHEWACFQAQQAGEKALKSFLYSRGYTSILSHSLTELVRTAGKLEPEFHSVDKPARRLDTFYIPTRYPNGLAGELTPSEFYKQEDANQCLNSAESILNITRKFTNN